MANKNERAKMGARFFGFFRLFVSRGFVFIYLALFVFIFFFFNFLFCFWVAAAAVAKSLPLLWQPFSAGLAT